MKNLKLSFILLILLSLLSLLACNKQPVELPEIPTEEDTTTNTPRLDLTPEHAVTYDLDRVSCIPSTIVTADPALEWLGGIHKGDQQYGKGQAYIGNYFWETSARAAYYDDRVEILLTTAISEDQPFYTIDDLLFVIDRNSEGCIPLDAVSTFSVTPFKGYASYAIVQYDVLVTEYELMPEEYHQIEITKLDTINNRISGNFRFTVKQDRIRGHEIIPRTIEFINGSFDCEILE